VIKLITKNIFTMKNHLFTTLTILIAGVWACKNSTQPAPATPPVAQAETNVQLLTHREAADTLLADSTAALKPIIYKTLAADRAKALLLKENPLSLLVNTWPDNGFYGADRYRIEFIITSVTPDPNDPMIYLVTGKNRFKKTISDFSGKILLSQVSELNDLNIDTAEVGDMGYSGKYYTNGVFKFDEDASLSSSGSFVGQFQMEFVTRTNNELPDLWYFSQNSRAKGAGYIFEGNWESFTKPDMNKPVLWSRDIFRLGNDILEEFSYGEREVEINPKYRHLGWDEFWSGEEWWAESQPEAKPLAK
jgi:hypothetical protein